MARIHAHVRGKSHSSRPAALRAPSWVTYSPEEVATLIVKLAKEGLSPTQIGLRLRDEYSIPLGKPISGKSIAEILAENNMLPKTPEDLDSLLKRAKRLQEHLKANPADHKNVRSLELLEAKIHRLSKHYKRTGLLPDGWKYSAVIAQLA